MNILVTMAAIAFTLGVGGQEVWTVQDPAIGFEHVSHEIAEVIVEQPAQPAQCVSAPIEWADGSPTLGGYDTWVFTGGVETGQVRLAVVGRFVWVATGYLGNQPPASWDMVIWSVEVFEGDEAVKVCLPTN